MDTSSPEFQEALRDHAQSLNVNLDLESYLLPLVQEALLADLPRDWEQGETEDGTLYYFNSSTEESVWEHPLDAHYREVIQTVKERRAATLVASPSTAPAQRALPEPTSNLSITSVTSPVDGCSFDDKSDHETSPPIVSALVSQINDRFAEPPRPSISGKRSETISPLSELERPRATSMVATSFGRDRASLLDRDDDVAWIENQVLSFSSTRQEDETTAQSSGGASESTDVALITQQSDPLPSFSSTLSNVSTDAIDSVPISHFPDHYPEMTLTWPSSLAFDRKGPNFHTTLPQATATALPLSIATMHELETNHAVATRALESERVAHSETTRKLAVALQEAKECTYLKMKVNDLKSHLAAQKTAHERQQHTTLTETTRMDRAEGQTGHLVQEQPLQQVAAKEEAARAELQAKCDELAALRVEFEKITQQHGATMDEQTTKYALVTQQKEDGERNQEATATQLAVLRRDSRLWVCDQATKCEQLKAMHKVMSSQQERAREMATATCTLQTAIDRLEREKSQGKATIEALKQELHEGIAERATLHKLTSTLQANVTALQTTLATVAAQQGKPLEKHCDELQRQVDDASAHGANLEAELRATKQAMAVQTDRAAHFELEVNVLVRREQQHKGHVEALATAKSTAETQLAMVRDELCTVQSDQRVECDRLTVRVRELERQVMLKEYEAGRQEERCVQVESWRAKEASRVAKRETQLMELRDQVTVLHARQKEDEQSTERRARRARQRAESTEISDLRMTKQQMALKLQKLEVELTEARDTCKRTEGVQQTHPTVAWQLPQLAQACVARLSDEWAQKCRVVAKNLRNELRNGALTERHELIARERQALEACERVEQTLRTALAEKKCFRREAGRLQAHNKVLLAQLHTLQVSLTPPSGPPRFNATVPSSDSSTVNQLNTQLGILHAQFQQFFDSNERQKSTACPQSDCFSILNAPRASKTSLSARVTQTMSQEDQVQRHKDEEAETQRLAVDALMEQKRCTDTVPSPLQRQQDELLTTLESLQVPTWRRVPYLPPPIIHVNEEYEEEVPQATLWYQRDYWRNKYQ